MITLLALLTPDAQAKSEVGHTRSFGIGLGGGFGVTGLSLKLHDHQTSYQLMVGGFGEGDAFLQEPSIGLDWLSEMGSFAHSSVLDLAASIGIGGYGVFTEEVSAGLAGVLGLELLLVPLPIDVVLEYRPTYSLTPDQEFDPVGFTAHARVWF